MMNSEQYENLISLMKEALKFYANSDNYYPSAEFELSLMLKDSGSQARFALNKIQETLDTNKKLQEDYNKVMSDTINAIENNPINLGDMITTLKYIEDDNNV